MGVVPTKRPAGMESMSISMRNRKWLVFNIARNVGTALKSVPIGVSHFVIAFTNRERK